MNSYGQVTDGEACRLRENGGVGITRPDREWMETQARSAGFDRAALAAVPDAVSDEAFTADQRFTEWVAEGYAAEMEWLKRRDEDGRLVRGDLRRSMPWARSVLVCALNYNVQASLKENVAAPRSIDPAPSDCGWIARYAWSGQPEDEVRAQGSDYHDVMLPKLRKIEAAVRERFEGCETRCYVDTGPVLEREFAQRAGLGWVGKNTCVLNQQLGSWLLLGVLVTSLELEGEAWTLPAADRCGSCTRCIEACPTEALVAPRVLDASRCIAYLTIEKRGVIDEELRAKMGRQVFGCDICQDVCPWNRKAPIAASSSLPMRAELVNPPLDWLAAMDGPEFNRWFRGSPLERTRRKRVLRNVAIAMGNSSERGFLPRLREWAEGEDEVLAEAARWAIARLENGAVEPPCSAAGVDAPVIGSSE